MACTVSIVWRVTGNAAGMYRVEASMHVTELRVAVAQSLRIAQWGRVRLFRDSVELKSLAQTMLGARVFYEDTCVTLQLMVDTCGCHACFRGQPVPRLRCRCGRTRVCRECFDSTTTSCPGCQQIDWLSSQVRLDWGDESVEPSLPAEPVEEPTVCEHDPTLRGHDITVREIAPTVLVGDLYHAEGEDGGERACSESSPVLDEVSARTLARNPTATTVFDSCSEAGDAAAADAGPLHSGDAFDAGTAAAAGPLHTRAADAGTAAGPLHTGAADSGWFGGSGDRQRSRSRSPFAYRGR